MATHSDQHRTKLAAEIAQRLSRVRGAMTDEEFEQLVASMVRTAERFAEIDGVRRRRVASETDAPRRVDRPDDRA